MQSLDLSYSVKNVKRDFANGFLVAEILSRYYKADIQMHSFDNGIGLVKRIQNWSLLEKFFRKVGFAIERRTMDDVIHCKAGAAVPLMEQLYTLLTHKTIQASRPQRDTEVVPAFARPTASQLIKERMSEADLAADHTLDARLAPQKAAAVLAEHMQKLKVDRETDPARFAPSKPATAAAGAQKRGGPGQPVQFKEVQVRQVDDRSGVLQLRANHVYHQQLPGQQHPAAAAASAAVSPSRANGGAGDEYGFDPSTAAGAPIAAAYASHPQPSAASGVASSSAAAPSAPILSLLSSSLSSLLIGTPLLSSLAGLSGSQGKELATVFGETCASMADGEAAGLFHALGVHTLDAMVAASLANPKEYYLLSNFFLSTLASLPIDSQAFYQATHLFSALGCAMVQRDGHLTGELFRDFTLPRFLALLQEQPAKVFQLAGKILYGFTPETVQDHGRVLEATRVGLGAAGGGNRDAKALEAFYSVLASLAPYEGALLTQHDLLLLKAYLKFVSVGLSGDENTARTRAVALSILAPLCANSANLGGDVLEPILNLLSGLLPPPAASTGGADGEKTAASSPALAGTHRRLANNEWVVDAELLHVLACILDHSFVAGSPAWLAQIHRWIEALMTAPGVPLPTILAGLAHLAHVLGQQPPLRRVWLSVLLERDDVRARVLADEGAAEDDAPAEEDTTPLSPSAPATDSSSSSSSASLLTRFVPSLRRIWHPLTVAQTLADMVRVSRLDNLTAGHIELLEACVQDAFGGAGPASGSPIGAPFPDEESSEWCRLFLALRDHLVVELCDAGLCERVISILRRFLFDARTSPTAQSIFLPNDEPVAGAVEGSPAPPPLYCIMRFMYPDAAEESQLNLAGFLEELASTPAFVGLVHRNLQVFADNEPEKFADSPLRGLLDKLNQQAAEADGMRRQ